MANTERFDLTSTAWTLVASGEADVALLRMNHAGVVLHIADSAPLIAEDSLIPFYDNDMRDFRVFLSANEKVYARATDNDVTVPIVAVTVASSSGGGGSNANKDHEFVVSTYTAKTAFTGASVGDTITGTQVIHFTGNTPSTETVLWRNQTTAADLSGAPSAANLELVGTQALTNAQLRSSPLDVEPAFAPSGIAPMTGAFTAVGNSANFSPIAGRAFNITISGTFAATIRLERSLDGGGNFVPITAGGQPFMVFTAPCSERWSEDQNGVMYRLACIAFTSGSAAYRISQ
jgi:hypothetical protein